MHGGVRHDHRCSWVLWDAIGMKSEKTTTPMANRLGEDDHAACRPLVQILDRIGSKWTVMVVGTLSEGPMRFNAMLRLIGGISHRMLTLTLRGLERDGLVKRRAYATIPPKVVYDLTPAGRSLIVPLGTLWKWAQENRSVIESAQAAFDAERPAGDREPDSLLPPR
jgi:DNA-binding HxlR family transcriptional regulator